MLKFSNRNKQIGIVGQEMLILCVCMCEKDR